MQTTSQPRTRSIRGIAMLIARVRSVLSLLLIIAVSVAAAAFLSIRSAAPMTDAASSWPLAGGAIDEAEPSAGQQVGMLSAKQVPDAQEAVQRRMIDEFGLTCLTQSDVLLWIPETAPETIEKQIVDAGLNDEGWVVDQKLWLGSAVNAAVAMAATAMYEDENAIWVLLVDKSGPRGVQLVDSQSTSGKTVWSTLNQVSQCASTNPADD